LLAGPIERAKDLIPQFHQVQRFDLLSSKKALLRIIWGVFKKVVIADRLAIFVNHAYDHPDDLTGLTAITVLVFFVIQLYCDFSGYCDMAIGMARLLGFKLSENFNRPLFAASVGDLYRRWHITIHKWFRDYLYASLPRHRNKAQKCGKVLFVFIVAGLWHGTSLNFLFWGLLNGLFIILMDPLLRHLNRTRFRGVRMLAKALPSLLVYPSLVFFRSDNFHDAWVVLQALFDWNYGAGGILKAHYELFGLCANELVVSFLLIVILLVIEMVQLSAPERINNFYRGHGLYRWGTAFSLSCAIVLLGFYDNREGAVDTAFKKAAQQEFVYERF
jgi:D-alanyl-lipoteichoic acid acyltransferase DltB (MBOAT superfamily)